MDLRGFELNVSSRVRLVGAGNLHVLFIVNNAIASYER